MAEPTPTPAPDPTPTPTPTPTPAPTTWHQGLDADLIGHAQNKGWKLDDPKAAFEAAAKAHREAQKFVGVPTERLIRLPEKADDTEGWNGVYQRLGAPKEASEYDAASLKHADGSAPAPALVDVLRATAAAHHVAKDKFGDFAAPILKHLDGAKASETAERTAKLNAEKAELAKSWGTTPDKLADHMNRLTAMQGAKRLGVDPETVALLENHVGYSKVMEMFRKIGAGTTEDTFVEGKTNGAPATVAAAQARKSELMADQAWAKRFTAGDSEARREMSALNQIIAGVAA